MLITALNAPSFADERGEIQKGEGITLEKAIEIAVNETSGKVLEAEFEEGIYEVKIRTDSGERVKFKVNLKDGTIIRKGRIIKDSSRVFSKHE